MITIYFIRPKKSFFVLLTKAHSQRSLIDGKTIALLLVISDVLHSRLLLSRHCATLAHAKCAGQLIWLYVKRFGLGNRYET